MKGTVFIEMIESCVYKHYFIVYVSFCLSLSLLCDLAYILFCLSTLKQVMKVCFASSATEFSDDNCCSKTS